MADGASDEGELSDKVYGTVDAPVRFKPDARKRSGFPLSGDEEKRKGDRQTKKFADTVGLELHLQQFFF